MPTHITQSKEQNPTHVFSFVDSKKKTLWKEDTKLLIRLFISTYETFVYCRKNKTRINGDWIRTSQDILNELVSSTRELSAKNILYLDGLLLKLNKGNIIDLDPCGRISKSLDARKTVLNPSLSPHGEGPQGSKQLDGDHNWSRDVLNNYRGCAAADSLCTFLKLPEETVFKGSASCFSCS